MRADTRSNGRPDRPREVYDQLRRMIVHGRLAPGSRLVETDLATRLGVSRTPVRGALQRLEQEGYIVYSPSMRQSRPSVAPLSSTDAQEVFDIVGQLEALAAYNATVLPAPKRQALVRKLTLINRKFKKAAERPRLDHNQLWTLDERFHACCVEAGGGPRVRLLHDSVKPQAERYERLYVSYLAGEIATSAAEHEQIIAAIAQGDARGAKAAMERNWHNAARRLSRVIRRVGERGLW
ncbi:MAG: GntR family transcriptional regulator [Gemmatimonadales bacterium]